MAFAYEEDYKKVIEALPKERCFRLYSGFWFDEVSLPVIMHFQKLFKPRPDDIYLMTYPKCGTTWIKALAFSVLNRQSFSFENHPLLTTHPQDLAQSLSNSFDPESWELLPSPRLFGLHLPYSLLPDSIKDDDDFNCKIIYVTRDPKDAFISRYFFTKEISLSYPFNEAFVDFCDGYGAYGSIWYHRMEYERESMKRPDKVLFLTYEKLKELPEEHVRRIAEFLGRPFSEEEERKGVVEKIVKLCSFDFLKELEVNKQGINGQLGNFVFKNSDYFRKGKVGGWKDHLSAEMAERIDKITQQKQDEYGLA